MGVEELTVWTDPSRPGSFSNIYKAHCYGERIYYEASLHPPFVWSCQWPLKGNRSSEMISLKTVVSYLKFANSANFRAVAADREHETHIPYLRNDLSRVTCTMIYWVSYLLRWNPWVCHIRISRAMPLSPTQYQSSAPAPSSRNRKSPGHKVTISLLLLRAIARTEQALQILIGFNLTPFCVGLFFS